MAAFTVTVPVPDDTSVSGCAAAEFTATLPNVKFVVLTFSAAITASNCRKNDCETPFTLAESVTVSCASTAEAVATKPALVAPPATVTEAGTLTDALLLAREIVSPPLGAGALSVTVQRSAPAPVMVSLVQVKALNAGVATVAPVPLRFTITDPSAAASLLIVSSPSAAPVTVGEKITFKLKVPPAATVIGISAVPLNANDLPETLTFETSTGVEVWLIRATPETAVCPTGTDPNMTTPGDARNGPVSELGVPSTLLVHPVNRIGRQSNAVKKRTAVARKPKRPARVHDSSSQQSSREIWRNDSLVEVKMWINESPKSISYDCVKI